MSLSFEILATIMIIWFRGAKVIEGIGGSFTEKKDQEIFNPLIIIIIIILCLEEQRFEERIGGSFTEKKDQEIFMLDTGGEDRKEKKKRKKEIKPLK